MKKVIASLLCLCLLFTAIAIKAPSDVHAATKQELEEKVEKIEAEIAENQKKIDSLKDKKASEEKKVSLLESQISAQKEKVDAIETQVQTIDNEIEVFDKKIQQLKNEIDVLRGEIKQKNKQIAKTKKAIDDSKDQLCEKLRASYITGTDSNLKILMGSSNLASFLTHLEMMKRISENDKRIIDEFKEKVKKYREAKAELEKKEKEVSKKKSEVEAAKQEKVDKKKELSETKAKYNSALSELESSYSNISAYISQLDKDSAAYKSYISKLEAERKQADAEIDRIIQSYQATTSATTAAPSTPQTGGSYNTDKSWAWPLGSGYSYVSSGYGYRDASISGWSFHGGADITTSAAEGKPIYAAREGTVIAAVWGTTGYGRYVIIDHGDGFVTLYGHCSNLTVSQGQHVSKGQQIANVGHTGNAYGSHLHFEVRQNGVKQNPLNYVSP